MPLTLRSKMAFIFRVRGALITDPTDVHGQKAFLRLSAEYRMCAKCSQKTMAQLLFRAVAVLAAVRGYPAAIENIRQVYNSNTSAG